jgi:hypothetical protein
MDDLVQILGRIDDDSFEGLACRNEGFIVCDYFQTGEFDPIRHHVPWLANILNLSRMAAGINIVKATFRSHTPIDAHEDPPGFNYLWLHKGKGFCYRGELLDLDPGTVIQFRREYTHEVRDLGEDFYRSNMVGVEGIDGVKHWHSHFPVQRWFRDGEIFGWDGPEPVPWLPREA